MNETFKPNTKNYKVLTPNGFQSFAGISMRGVKPILRLEFERGAWIECTYNHKIYISLSEYKTAEELVPGDEVVCVGELIKLVSKMDLNRSEPVYDLIEVENGHRYYTNTILSSNCEFLIFDETLINPVKLAEMQGDEPYMTMGQTRWYKDIDPHATYLVALDPSLGTGGDYAALQVFEMPTMEQVAEWRHNLTPIQNQVKHLRDICKYIQDRGAEKGGNVGIYYSVENNSIGESALLCISNIGEENIPGLFLSEPIRKGHIRKFRKGFNTTHRSKITACSQFKHLLETQKMRIRSKPLISELKIFVSHGVTFGAKSGENDDLISAVLLIIRMANILSDWDPKIYEKMTDKLTEEQMPMPIFVTQGIL
jgi:intein/homing endonuclease